jgi:hypothetical protein
MAFSLVAVVCCGLFAGAAIYISLVEHPARLECGVPLALTEFRASYGRAARLQASLAGVGSLAAGATWLSGAGTGWLLGGLLLVSVVPFTLLVILPTNKALLDPQTANDLPRARELLVRWGRLHAVRSVVSGIAFVLFVALL